MMFRSFCLATCAATLGLGGCTATVARDAPQAAAALRQALAANQEPESWHSMLSDLGRIGGVAAEVPKADGDLEAAVEAYAVSHALTPGAASYEHVRK